MFKNLSKITFIFIILILTVYAVFLTIMKTKQSENNNIKKQLTTVVSNTSFNYKDVFKNEDNNTLKEITKQSERLESEEKERQRLEEEKKKRLEASPALEANSNKNDQLTSTSSVKSEKVTPQTVLNNLNRMNRKHRFDLDYLTIIYNSCNKDGHSLKLIVAIAGAETSFGTVGSPMQGYPNNYWGWGYNSKTKTYTNGSREQMANALCSGFRPGARYYTVINNGIVRRDLAVLYTGNDRADTWARTVLSFYNNL